jgi:hypothetical protein
MIQAVNVKHNKAGETTEPGMYRINDDLVNHLLLGCKVTRPYMRLSFIWLI